MKRTSRPPTWDDLPSRPARNPFPSHQPSVRINRRRHTPCAETVDLAAACRSPDLAEPPTAGLPNPWRPTGRTPCRVRDPRTAQCKVTAPRRYREGPQTAHSVYGNRHTECAAYDDPTRRPPRCQPARSWVAHLLKPERRPSRSAPEPPAECPHPHVPCINAFGWTSHRQLADQQQAAPSSLSAQPVPRHRRCWHRQQRHDFGPAATSPAARHTACSIDTELAEPAGRAHSRHKRNSASPAACFSSTQPAFSRCPATSTA